MTRKKVRFETGNGGTLVGTLSYPQGRDKVPVVILLHGWASERKGSRNKLLTKLLTEQRIGTLAIDFWGQGESEGDINQVTVRTERTDIVAAVDFLSTRRRANMGRLAVMGTSIGGSALLHMLSHDAEARFKCAVLNAPRTSFQGLPEDMYCTTRGERRIENHVMLPVGLEIDFYAEARLASLPPTLVLHGTNDEFIPVDQSRKLAATNEQFTLFEIEGGDHMMRDPRFLSQVVETTVNFLTKHLV